METLDFSICRSLNNKNVEIATYFQTFYNNKEVCILFFLKKVNIVLIWRDHLDSENQINWLLQFLILIELI